MCSRTVRLSTVVSRLREVGKLLGISECLDVKTGSDVRKCLDVVVRQIRTIVGSGRGEDPLECAVMCVEEFMKNCRKVKTLNESTKQLFSAMFTLGDSPIDVEEAKHRSIQARRAIRHFEYVVDTSMHRYIAAPHLARILYWMYIVDKFIKCLEKCGIDKIVNIVQTFIESIDMPEDEKENLRKWLIESLTRNSSSSQPHRLA